MPVGSAGVPTAGSAVGVSLLTVMASTWRLL
jgi:hypothetical protein